MTQEILLKLDSLSLITPMLIIILSIFLIISFIKLINWLIDKWHIKRKEKLDKDHYYAMFLLDIQNYVDKHGKIKPDAKQRLADAKSFLSGVKKPKRKKKSDIELS